MQHRLIPLDEAIDFPIRELIKFAIILEILFCNQKRIFCVILEAALHLRITQLRLKFKIVYYYLQLQIENI